MSFGDDDTFLSVRCHNNGLYVFVDDHDFFLYNESCMLIAILNHKIMTYMT